MGDCGTTDPTCQAQPTRRTPSEGPHAGSPAYAILPEPQWLPMGYVAARPAAILSENRLRLFEHSYSAPPRPGLSRGRVLAGRARSGNPPRHGHTRAVGPAASGT